MCLKFKIQIFLAEGSLSTDWPPHGSLSTHLNHGSLGRLLLLARDIAACGASSRSSLEPMYGIPGGKVEFYLVLY